MLVAVSAIVRVDAFDEVFHGLASQLVLVLVAARNAQVKWLVALFLLGSFLEARSLSSESELDNILDVLVGGTFAASLDDPLHIAPFGSDESPGHLEGVLIVDLHVESASELYVFVNVGTLLGVRREDVLLIMVSLLQRRPGRLEIRSVDGLLGEVLLLKCGRREGFRQLHFLGSDPTHLKGDMLLFQVEVVE